MKTKKLIRGRAPQSLIDDLPASAPGQFKQSKIYDTTVVVTLADGSHRVTSFRNGAEFASFKQIVRAMRDATTIHAATGAAVFEGRECFRYTANEVVELMTDRRYA